MARKKVVDLNAESTISWEKTGQQLNGYYIGFKTVTTDFGPSKLHVFQTESGSVGCWGSAQLDAKLGTVERGCATFVTFEGKSKIAGGKTLKSFSVEYDDEDKVDLGNISVQYDRNGRSDDQADAELEAGSDEGETQDVDQDAPDSDEDTETELNPAQEKTQKKGAPVGPTPSQRSKAMEMLNKHRNTKTGKVA